MPGVGLLKDKYRTPNKGKNHEKQIIAPSNSRNIQSNMETNDRTTLIMKSTISFHNKKEAVLCLSS